MSASKTEAKSELSETHPFLTPNQNLLKSDREYWNHLLMSIYYPRPRQTMLTEETSSTSGLNKDTGQVNTLSPI